MAGLEDFYPDLKYGERGGAGMAGSSGPSPMGFRQFDQDLYNYGRQSSTPKTSKVPLLVDRTKPPRLITNPSQELDENDDKASAFCDTDHYANLGISAVGLVLQNVGNHPFVVLRRQCAVSSESYRYHQTPFTLIPVMVNLYRLQVMQNAVMI